MRFFTQKPKKATNQSAQASPSTASTSKLNIRSRESQASTQVTQPIASSSPGILSPAAVKKTQALWERAYDNLKIKENKLVDAYERVLSRELKGGISGAGRYWLRAGLLNWIVTHGKFR
jgi:hypothetical protein